MNEAVMLISPALDAIIENVFRFALHNHLHVTIIAPAEQKKGMKGRISNFSITGNKMI